MGKDLSESKSKSIFGMRTEMTYKLFRFGAIIPCLAKMSALPLIFVPISKGTKIYLKDERYVILFLKGNNSIID